MHLTVQATAIAGVKVVGTRGLSDARGTFARLFCEEALGGVLEGRRIVQINHSGNVEAGTVRGLHFQYPPHAEMKLVRCLRGRIWDVAVDLRKGSPSFLQWHAEMLSGDNQRMLVIPEGCAHGYQVLEPDSVLLYLHTAAYAPEAEGSVAYDDPRLGIPWPLPPTGLSEKDRQGRRLDAGFAGVAL